MINAYSAIVWPRPNSRARTTKLVIPFICAPFFACVNVSNSVFMWGGGRVASATPFGTFVLLLLELAVHGGEQRGDGRAHRLVADEHYDRDVGHDHRVLSHRLSLLKLPSLPKHSYDLVHRPV